MSEFWDKHPCITNGLGVIGGVTYTNSKEAFLENYHLGVRLFEVDITLTEDGKLICRHKSMPNFDIHEHLKISKTIRMKEQRTSIMLYQEFIDAPIVGKYTPMDIFDLAVLLNQYHGVYMILDSGTTNTDIIKKQYAQVMEAFTPYGDSVLSRVIPEVPSPEAYDSVLEFYPFERVLYFAPHIDERGEYTCLNMQILLSDLSQMPKVEAITMRTEAARENYNAIKLHKAHHRVLTHMVYGLDHMQQLQEYGVDNIFSPMLHRKLFALCDIEKSPNVSVFLPFSLPIDFNLLNGVVTADKKIIICGSRGTGQVILWLLRLCGIEPFCFCETADMIESDYVAGIPVLTPRDLADSMEDCAVIFASAYSREIYDDMSLSEGCVMYRSFLPPYQYGSALIFNQVCREKLERYIFEKDKKLIVFGAGPCGRNTIKTLLFLNRKVDFVCDNNCDLWGTSIDGIKICSPRVLLTMDGDYNLIIASHHLEAIRDQLAEHELL